MKINHNISKPNGNSAFSALVFFLAAIMLFFVLLPDSYPAFGQNAVDESPVVFPGESWERIQDPSSAGYTAEGLAAVREYVKTLDTTGLMVIVGGRVLFEYGDLEQTSYIASVRKSILAILYGKYVYDGTIRLNTTLEELGITDHGGLLPIERKATINHLITARSGIYHPASNGGDSTAHAPERGSQELGTYFLYNNWDFNCAGAVFEMLTHQVIYDALERDLAVPLGMQDFDRFKQRKSGNLSRSRFPAYHIWSSTRDMARIGTLMLREGEWNGRRITPQTWVQKITRARTHVEEMNPEPYRKGTFGYGYMWWVWDGAGAEGPYKGAYTASGAYGQYITVLPVLDMVISHKTAVPPHKRYVRLNQYQGIIDRLIAAHLQK
ncbi:MAG: serine hydrolase [Candidatus Aminicenantes bacterium]|nr:serine hydrolase [Candidatus Aminicenantes bacterium]